MLGVQGGMLYNTAPIGSSEYFTSFESKPQMIVGGKLGIDTRKIQLGVGCNVSGVDYIREETIPAVFSIPAIIEYRYSSPVINPYLFLNIKKNLVRSFLYFGINAGFARFNSGKDEVYAAGVPFDYAGVNGTIPSAGLQAGARIKLMDGMGISAEAAMRYTSAAPGMHVHKPDYSGLENYKGGIFSFPLTLGVDYIF